MRRICLLIAVFCLPMLAAEEPATLDRALQSMYNFDFQSSQDILNKLIAASPQDPLPHAFRASGFLFSELDRLGILESEFLTDDEKIADKKVTLQPDPVVRKFFMDALDATESRANVALARNPNDKNALFAMAIAQGVLTDYVALVDKKQLSSLSPAKRSNSYAQKLLKIDPGFYDAYLTAGFSEYMIGSLPFFVRWFVRFDNVSGSKEKGVQNLLLTARQGHYFRAFAKILIGIVNLREKKPQEAQKLLTELAVEYPRNPLFRKELARLNTKLGIAAN